MMVFIALFYKNGPIIIVLFCNADEDHVSSCMSVVSLPCWRCNKWHSVNLDSMRHNLSTYPVIRCWLQFWMATKLTRIKVNTAITQWRFYLGTSGAFAL